MISKSKLSSTHVSNRLFLFGLMKESKYKGCKNLSQWKHTIQPASGNIPHMPHVITSSSNSNLSRVATYPLEGRY